MLDGEGDRVHGERSGRGRGRGRQGGGTTGVGIVEDRGGPGPTSVVKTRWISSSATGTSSVPFGTLAQKSSSIITVVKL